MGIFDRKKPELPSNDELAKKIREQEFEILDRSFLSQLHELNYDYYTLGTVKQTHPLYQSICNSLENVLRSKTNSLEHTQQLAAIRNDVKKNDILEKFSEEVFTKEALLKNFLEDSEKWKNAIEKKQEISAGDVPTLYELSQTSAADIRGFGKEFTEGVNNFNNALPSFATIVYTENFERFKKEILNSDYPAEFYQGPFGLHISFGLDSRGHNGFVKSKEIIFDKIADFVEKNRSYLNSKIKVSPGLNK